MFRIIFVILEPRVNIIAVIVATISPIIIFVWNVFSSIIVNVATTVRWIIIFVRIAVEIIFKYIIVNVGGGVMCTVLDIFILFMSNIPRSS